MQYPCWKSRSATTLPIGIAPFLTERGSLTQKMVAATGCECEVGVQHEGWQLPADDEATCLKEFDAVWVREVVLRFGEYAVFARSLFPKTLVDLDSQFQGLGGKPLGAVLFQDPSVSRGEIEVAQVSRGHALYDKAVVHLIEAPSQLWARRSVFRYQGNSLLVCEVMFPNVATL